MTEILVHSTPNKHILYNSESKHTLSTFVPNIIDSIVTDPPYHLQSIVNRFKNTSIEDSNTTGENAKTGANPFARGAKGFMGKEWDGGDIAFDPEFWKECFRVLKPGGYLIAFSASRNYHRMACAIEDAGFEIRDQIMWLYGSGFPKSHNQGNGWGTALKPAHEPMVLARKPLSESTVKSNIELHGTGGINIEDCRVEGGRWPANVIHDGSDEVINAFPSANSGGSVSGQEPSEVTQDIYGKFAERLPFESYGDSGSAARFFYSAKTSTEEKNAAGDNTHPTVKPISLMEYLIKLVTPKGGTTLDPFMGSGSTGVAAENLGFKFIGIEREKEYYDISLKRIEKAEKDCIMKHMFI